jgi:catechol 2,3-dioxygenase-like lactoylglutathione lyase family enzyme
MSRTAGRLRSPGEGLDRRGPRHRKIRRMYLMSHIRRFDHVGITVADLDAATELFVGLGLEVEGRMFMEGEFVDTVIGIPGSHAALVGLWGAFPPGSSLQVGQDCEDALVIVGGVWDAELRANARMPSRSRGRGSHENGGDSVATLRR